MDENKIIIVSHGLKKEMMEVLDTSYPSIRSALAFKTNTMKAKVIRKYALDHGGKLVEMYSEQFFENKSNKI